MKHFISFTLALLLLASPTGVVAHRMQHLEAASSRDEDVQPELLLSSSARSLKNTADYEITNNSNEVKDTLTIYPHSFTLKPVPESLTEDQLTKIKNVAEGLLNDKLKFYFPSIITDSVQLYSLTETQWVGRRRMLRNGRELADGATTEPISYLTISGGRVNTTIHLYCDDPSDARLNAKVSDVLNDDLLKRLRKENEFQPLTDIDIVDTMSISSIIDVDTRGPEKSNATVLSAVFGVLAAVCVALGAALYARKKVRLDAERGKDHELSSNLQMSTLRRRRRKDDYLVEICTDDGEVSQAKSRPPLIIENKSPPRGSFTNDCRDLFLCPSSPSSVKGSRQKMIDKKPLDPSEYSYMIEVCED